MFFVSFQLKIVGKCYKTKSRFQTFEKCKRDLMFANILILRNLMKGHTYNPILFDEL